ncbi:MAG: dual specificity protein phosphatase family protein [Patescibacteria group bacterium]
MRIFDFLSSRKDAHGKNLPPFEFSEITEQVFIGNNACCRIHFEFNLLRRGISADISLEKEQVDHPYGVETYLWLPTEDHTAPSKENAAIGIEAIEAILKQGRKVFIHCKNGHGRGPTLYAAYLISQGMTPEQAVAAIKAKRPATHLEESQLTFLRSLAK